jgi:hypothetical protein
MASVPVDKVAEVHVRGSVGGQFTENTLYYEFASAITQALLDALVEAVTDVVISEWLPLLSGDWVGREVFARDLTSGSGLQSTFTDLFGEVGTASGGGLPGNVTLAIARKTALAGRSFAGRIFWQALATSQQSAVNTISSVAAAAIRDAVLAVDAAAVGLDWQPVVVSLFSGGAPRVAGVTTPITAWALTNLVIDSRRRRLPGRGI